MLLKGLCSDNNQTKGAMVGYALKDDWSNHLAAQMQSTPRLVCLAKRQTGQLMK